MNESLVIPNNRLAVAAWIVTFSIGAIFWGAVLWGAFA